MIEFNMDYSAAGPIMGAISGAAMAVKTQVYIRDLVKGVQHELGGEFNKWLAMRATLMPERFHHVFEWNQVGNLGERLWKNVYSGSSARNMTSSFSFIPSKTEVPLPADEPAASEKTGKSLQGGHIFWNKAFIMEYNIPVTIFPKEAKALFFNNGTTWIFRERAYVRNPGGSATTGSFTSAFIEFYNEVAPGIFEETIKPRIEKSTSALILASGRKSTTARIGNRASMKQFEIYYNAAREQVRKSMMIEAERYSNPEYDTMFSEVFQA